MDGEKIMGWCIAICDDEKLWMEYACEAIESYQQEREKEVKICCYRSAEEYLEKKNAADVLLLDIKMEEMSGIELKNRLAKDIRGEAIIFMTNYSSYMSAAFGRNVYGFLEKPIKRENLYELLDQIMTDRDLDMELRINDGEFIHSRDILYIKALDKYVKLHLKQGDKMGYLSLGECEKRLSNLAFMRIHKSYMIHFEYVEKIGSEVKLVDGSIIKVGRGKLKKLRENYYRYAKMRAR